jgi:hypothetical protein
MLRGREWCYSQPNYLLGNKHINKRLRRVALHLPRYHDSDHRAVVATSGGGAHVGSSHTDMTNNASLFSCPRGRKRNRQRDSAILLQSASNPSYASGKGMIGSSTRLGPWSDSGRPCGGLEKCRTQRGDGQNVSSGLPSAKIGRHARRALAKRLRRSWKRGTCRKHSTS